MKKYNKFKPQRNKLEKWQLWAIIGAAALLVVATVVFIVLFYANIFTENVLIWCLVILFLIFVVGGTLFFVKITKKE